MIPYTTTQAIMALCQAAYLLNEGTRFGGEPCRLAFAALRAIDPDFQWGDFESGTEAYNAWHRRHES